MVVHLCTRFALCLGIHMLLLLLLLFVVTTQAITHRYDGSALRINRRLRQPDAEHLHQLSDALHSAGACVMKAQQATCMATCSMRQGP
jgi:hypothetical protein